MPLPVVWTERGFYPTTDQATVYVDAGSFPIPPACLGVRPRVALIGPVWKGGRLVRLSLGDKPNRGGSRAEVALCGCSGIGMELGRRLAADRVALRLDTFRPGDVANAAEDNIPDGSVDVSDLLAFLAWYETGDVRADFDADGGVTVGDILAFLAAFEAGGVC